MRHLGHLTPRPWPDRPRRAVIGAPQQDSYHPDQEQTTQRDRIVADGDGGIVWRGTGESDHSRHLSKAAWRIACCLEVLAGNQRGDAVTQSPSTDVVPSGVIAAQRTAGPALAPRSRPVAYRLIVLTAGPTLL